MRALIYARFSSDAQKSTSIGDQFRLAQAYVDREGWRTVLQVSDEAVSGSIPVAQRLGGGSILRAVMADEFDVLVMESLDRLSRDSLEQEKVVRLLEHRGIRLVGLSDGYDSLSNGRTLLRGVRGLINSVYLEDLAYKTHRGLMGQAIAGYSAGGLPYGYTSSSDGHGHSRQIHPEQADVVRWVFERYISGSSSRQIAHELNERGVKSPRGTTWCHSALYPDAKGVGVLGNPLYAGQQVWNRTRWVKDPATGRRRRTMRPPSEWVITEHPDLAIIDDATWRAAQARAKGQRHSTAQRKATEGKSAGGRGPKYLFSGLLRCGTCGGSYVVMDRYRYGCAAHNNRGPSACANGMRVARARIEEVLLEDVRRELLSPAAYTAFEAEARLALKAARPDPAKARQALAAARREADNLLTAIRAGIVTPSTKAALLQAEQKQQDAQDELAAIERFEPTQLLPRAREIYRDLVARLETIDDVASAREALRQLIGEVRLVPEGETLWAEMQNAGLAGVCQISVVAGARSRRYSAGLRLRLLPP